MVSYAMAGETEVWDESQGRQDFRKVVSAPTGRGFGHRRDGLCITTVPTHAFADLPGDGQKQNEVHDDHDDERDHDMGPVCEVARCHHKGRGELAMAVAVDMPFLSPDLLKTLVALAPGCDVVIPRAQDRLHPLCAVYRRTSCLPAIEQAIQRGQRRLIAFHPDVRVCEVDEETLRQVDPDLRALMNVNTPEELAAARALLGGRSQSP
jgi:molybdopterin-guanine dinucleotide biosynthesis protein A